MLAGRTDGGIDETLDALPQDCNVLDGADLPAAAAAADHVTGRGGRGLGGAEGLLGLGPRLQVRAPAVARAPRRAPDRDRTRYRDNPLNNDLGWGCLCLTYCTGMYLLLLRWREGSWLIIISLGRPLQQLHDACRARVASNQFSYHVIMWRKYSGWPRS